MGVYMGVRAACLRLPTSRYTPEVLILIAEIDEFKGAWRALGTLAPERLSALRRVATIESIGFSTRIEGQQAVRPRREAPARQSPCRFSDQILCHPRRAGGRRVRRGHGDDLPCLAGDSRHGEPHQEVPPRSFTLPREG